MVKYIFICCPGHSGSTLLDLLIGSHSRVRSLGEISHLSKNIALNTPCSCGVAVKECSFWKKIIQFLSESTRIDILKDPYAFNLGQPKSFDVIDHVYQTRMFLLRNKLMRGLVYHELRYGPDILKFLKKSFHKSITNNLILYDTILSSLSEDIVVDSTKDYLKAVGVYRKRPDNTRIILLSRDGRGVLYSRIKRGVKRRVGVASWKNYYSRGMPVLYRHISDEHILRIQYERLASEPETVLKVLTQFLEIEYEGSMLDFSNYTHHVTNGNNMRFIKSASIQVDESWKSNLLEEDIQYFNYHAGAMNRRLGYY